ncbi:MAG: polyketide cyclase [Actinobacteria bacterium]|uniref:Unannotated protein n=1 Tax=freshwater metagenome TaxID=449393 RepID=A0A6J6QIJ2_9ZZZZ|nr:polyketide cyclase [Actinomycetota bacterium]
MHVERTFTVPRPIEAVFDYLSDFESTNDWDPGTVTTTRTSGDGGVGTTYRNTSTFLGRTVELDYTTLTHDRPRELRFEGRNPSATATDHLRLSPAADGTATEIHYRATFEFRSAFKLVARLVVGPRLPSLADETVEQLTKTLLNKA